MFQKLKDALFESDSPPPPAEPVKPATPSTASTMIFAATPAAVAGDPAEADAVYQKVREATEFDNTPEGKTIQKYLKPLEAIPTMDPLSKFKAALAQAQAQEGLTPDKIIAAIESCSANLAQQMARFNDLLAQFNETEIVKRETRMAQIAETVTQLQTEHLSLGAELNDQRNRAAVRQMQFNSAVQRRTGEIEQQKTQFSNLLKG